MKTIVLAAAIAAVVAGPALAKSPDAVQRMQHVRQNHQVMNAHAAVTAPDPYGVYVDGREIGRDPDPNIRSSLQGEYYELQGQ
jgi:hypothetical protein